MRNNKINSSEPSSRITGDSVIGDLLLQNMILIPFAVDPHGRFGPILNHFLFHTTATLSYDFPTSRPNATIMFTKSTTTPCPIGILRRLLETHKIQTLLRTLLHCPDTFNIHNTTTRARINQSFHHTHQKHNETKPLHNPAQQLQSPYNLPTPISSVEH